LKLTDGLFNIDPAAFVFSPLRTYVTASGMYGIQAIPPILNVQTSAEYFDLQDAVDAAGAGNTLKFQLDYTIPTTVTINKQLTLDTNGKTISRTVTLPSDNSVVVGPGGDVTITGGGTITTTSGNAIMITGGAGSLAKVKLVDATLYGPNLSVGVVGNADATTFATPYPAVFEMVGGATNETVLARGNGAELIISGGTLTGAAPIMGNGTNDTVTNNGGTKITISGDAVIGSETLGWVAIYHPQEGSLTINGGTITGYNGIEMKAGDLVVTGGTIKGTGAFLDPTATGNGTTNTGDAILIFNRDGYGAGQTMDVTISGSPTITSTNGFALREFTLTGETSRLGVAAITGGTFDGGTPGAVSFTTNTDANLDLLPGGLYSTDPAAFVYVPYGSYQVGDLYGIRLLPSISGLVTMQGRLTRAGVPVALTRDGYLFEDISDDMTDINYAFIGVELGTYTFTTNQPRYLNISATVTIDSLVNRTLRSLRLFGGDVNQDDAITVSDASAVGTAWGSPDNPEANINYDTIVNIQDLALVGGNYGLISATAYNAWSPLP
jgi:hypothetical protein